MPSVRITDEFFENPGDGWIEVNDNIYAVVMGGQALLLLSCRKRDWPMTAMVVVCPWTECIRGGAKCQ